MHNDPPAAVGEQAEQTAAGIGRWVNSGAVAPAFLALCEMAAIGLGAPPGAGAAAGTSVGALMGSAAEGLINLNYKLWFNRATRLGRFAETADDAAGVNLDELLTEAQGPGDAGIAGAHGRGRSPLFGRVEDRRPRAHLCCRRTRHRGR